MASGGRGRGGGGGAFRPLEGLSKQRIEELVESTFSRLANKRSTGH